VPRISLIPLAVVTLLALLTLWLGKVAGSQAPLGSGGFSHDPDYVVENFAAMAFDTAGNPNYHLSALRMVHYMDDDSTELDRPRFERTPRDALPVRVSSQRGLVSPDGESVYFIGEVRVSRPAAPEQAAMEMAADYLRVIPDADILRTDKPVTLRQGASVIEASGLVIDGEKRYMQLNGRVKALYEHRK